METNNAIIDKTNISLDALRWALPMYLKSIESETNPKRYGKDVMMFCFADQVFFLMSDAYIIAEKLKLPQKMLTIRVGDAETQPMYLQFFDKEDFEKNYAEEIFKSYNVTKAFIE